MRGQKGKRAKRMGEKGTDRVKILRNVSKVEKKRHEQSYIVLTTNLIVCVHKIGMKDIDLFLY